MSIKDISTDVDRIVFLYKPIMSDNLVEYSWKIL